MISGNVDVGHGDGVLLKKFKLNYNKNKGQSSSRKVVRNLTHGGSGAILGRGSGAGSRRVCGRVRGRVGGRVGGSGGRCGGGPRGWAGGGRSGGLHLGQRSSLATLNE